MTHRIFSWHSFRLFNPSAKACAPILAGLLSLPVVLAGGAGLLSPTVAKAAVNEASCRIHAVEATKEGDGTIPPELEFLSDQLKAPEFAQYTGVRLMESKDFHLEVGKVVDQKFKSGHNVKLTLLGGEEGKLELQTELLRANTSVVKINLLMRVAQIVMIPVRRGDQAIIFAYQCKT